MQNGVKNFSSLFPCPDHTSRHWVGRQHCSVVPFPQGLTGEPKRFQRHQIHTGPLVHQEHFRGVTHTQVPCFQLLTVKVDILEFRELFSFGQHISLDLHEPQPQTDSTTRYTPPVCPCHLLLGRFSDAGPDGWREVSGSETVETGPG